jgi:hypothetical protein
MWNSADIGGLVSESGTGSVDVGPQNLDGITVTLSFANRGTKPNSLTGANINIDNTSSTTQTLNVIFGANGYLGPSSHFDTSSTILTALGGADLMGSFFVAGDNALNGLGTSVDGLDIGNFNSGSLLGPKSFSFNSFGLDTVSGPYGMAEELHLTLAPGAEIAVQGAAMTASVPEPKTWAMLILGFGMMAFMGAKKVRKDRLAALA